MEETRKTRELNLLKQRKSIILMLLAMLLCIVMASATTFAIFTNNLDDGKIGVNVTSGTIDIDIVDADGNSIVGDSLRFVAADGRAQSAIFFEPGSTYVTQGFRVKNIGTVAVNIRVFVSADKDTDMVEFEKAFEIFITDSPKNLNNARRLISFKDSLARDQETPMYYLVAHMKEEAGNGFKNVAYSGIGVTVHAVQGNVEIN